MLKFSDLSKAQKTFIVRGLEKFPEMRAQSTLTAKDIHTIYFGLKDERGSSNEKLGYPNWLQNKNRVGRGTYQMPWPTDAELSDYAKPVAAVKVVKQVKSTVASAPKAKQSRLEKIISDSDVYDQDTEDFNQILRDNGIEV